jgi:aryl-alcohol dehydrogenase-like predicted oxidoreductase
MERVSLGRSGLSVSPVCYGGWQANPKFWGEVPLEDLIAAPRRAFEVGVNFFDTADAYGDGRGEEILGEAVSVLPRDEIALATKVFHRFYPDGHRHGDLSKGYVLAECDASLKRLGTDYIDLYQCHNFDPMTPMEETTDAFETLLEKGKIRAYGVSNFTVEQLMLALKHGGYSTLQPRYNLLQRDAERDLLPFCKAEGLGVLTFSSIAKGLLSGRYEGTEEFDDHRARLPEFKGERFKEIAGRVKSLGSMAEKYGLSIVQLVIAATLMTPLVDVVIVGIKRPEQIESAAAAMGVEIDREDYFQIRGTVGTI